MQPGEGVVAVPKGAPDRGRPCSSRLLLSGQIRLVWVSASETRQGVSANLVTPLSASGGTQSTFRVAPVWSIWMTEVKRTRTALGLAAAMLVLTACGGGDKSSGSDGASDEPTAQENSENAEQAPDIEGIPDVVAEVNGEEVTKDEFVAVYTAQFQQASMQAQTSGGEQPDEDALRKQTAETLVDTELLAQEAEARGIAVGEQDVNDELSSLAKQNQMASADELLAALEKQGTTEDQARAQLEIQVMVEQLVADEAGPIEPTEKELRAIYQQAQQQQEQMGQQGSKQQPIPPYDEVKPQLEAQAKSERVGTIAQTLVQDLRKDADITINL